MISAIKLSDLCGQSVRRRAAYSITPTRNGCTILTKDGREFHSVFNLAKELEDDAEIRAVVPCHGVAALYYLGDNQTEIRPCPLMYLLSDGSLEPVEFASAYDIEECASANRVGFVGFVPAL